jgi:hypothetical protein
MAIFTKIFYFIENFAALVNYRAEKIGDKKTDPFIF